MTPLLDVGSNPKTVKSDAMGEYLTAIMYLASGNASGKEVCPKRSPGCSQGCLYTAGRAQVWPTVMAGRLRKTKLFHDSRTAFIDTLVQDIARHERRCHRRGVKSAVRLNGTSDIVWEVVAPTLFTTFPQTQFYDYTKIVERMCSGWVLPPNYHLTFSRSESNERDCARVLGSGLNVAAVFHGPMPRQWLGYPVYSGDSHDLRFTDPKAHVIGLKAKGRAKRDTTGFVIRT
jgi:hypothetical protein